MKISEEFLWKYAEKLEDDAATALVYAMEELETTNNPEIHVYVADALMALEDYEGAVEEINEALEKNIVNVNYALSLKGEALFYLEKYEESRKVFNDILKSTPNSFFVVAYLTDIDIKLGNYEEGIERAENILKSNTLNNTDAAYIKANVGWIKLKYLNNGEEAMKDFEAALKLDSNMGSVYIGIAEYYINKKEYEKALINYEKAIDLDEGSVDVYYNLAQCLKMMGHNDDAREYFNIVYQYDPAYKNVEILLDELNKH